jgi:hypothetical protein
MSFDSIATMGGMAGGGAPTGVMGMLMKALQAGKSINDLVGPKGALVTGNIPQGISAGQGLYGAGSDLFGSKAEKFGPDNLPANTPTTQSTMGMTREQFMGLDPLVREKLLRQLSENTNVFGSIR